MCPNAKENGKYNWDHSWTKLLIEQVELAEQVELVTARCDVHAAAAAPGGRARAFAQL